MLLVVYMMHCSERLSFVSLCFYSCLLDDMLLVTSLFIQSLMLCIGTLKQCCSTFLSSLHTKDHFTGIILHQSVAVVVVLITELLLKIGC